MKKHLTHVPHITLTRHSGEVIECLSAVMKYQQGEYIIIKEP